MPPLSDARCRALKPRQRPYKAYDEKGLFLHVAPSGGRLWRWRFTWRDREQLMSLGAYPEVTLTAARAARDAAMARLKRGEDPRQPERADVSFKAAALDWLADTARKRKWSADYVDTVTRRLELWVFPKIGALSVGDVLAKDLREVLLAIEEVGRTTTAHRVRSHCVRTIRYAAGRGWAPEDRDPSTALRDTLTPVVARKYPGLTSPDDVGRLVLAIRGYQGRVVTRVALQLCALWFVRSAELRYTRWENVDTDAALCRVPAALMKLPRDHLVPLSRQAIKLLEELRPHTERTGLLFPNDSYRREGRVLSENTLNGALRRLGYDTETEHCTHGWRTTASTVLHELRESRGWHRDAVEMQLAHVSLAKGDVEGIYNEAEYLPQRRKMMQAWADHLDALATFALEPRAASRIAIHSEISASDHRDDPPVFAGAGNSSIAIKA